MGFQSILKAECLKMIPIYKQFDGQLIMKNIQRRILGFVFVINSEIKGTKNSFAVKH